MMKPIKSNKMKIFWHSKILMCALDDTDMLLYVHSYQLTRDSSVGRAEDCSGFKPDILRSVVRLRLAGRDIFLFVERKYRTALPCAQLIAYLSNGGVDCG